MKSVMVFSIVRWLGIVGEVGRNGAVQTDRSGGLPTHSEHLTANRAERLKELIAPSEFEARYPLSEGSRRREQQRGDC